MNTQSSPEIIMYTTPWCSACWRAKQVMDAMRIAFTEIDITDDEEAADAVMRLNRGYRSVPTILFPDGSVLTEPNTVDLVSKLHEVAA